MQDLIKTMQDAQDALGKVDGDKKVDIVNNLVSLSKKLVHHIAAFADIPQNFSKSLYPTITAQITAADKRTEKAADDIMGAAESIMAIADNLEGDTKTKLMEQVNAIFETCSFQDLVAQHLNEIRLRVDDLKEDMDDLSDMANGNTSSEEKLKKRKQKRSDAHLLNGPATNV